jgi:thiol-disulfide isomerase/thioredoxin
MLRLSFATVALAAAFTAGATARQAADTGIVPAVRAAIADGGVTRGEETLAAYRASRGTTPEALEALCWLARGALAAKLHDKASRYADEAHTAAAAAFRSPDGAHDQRLLDVLSAAVELTALTLVEQGARSEAVYGLQQALTDYGATSLRPQIESTIALVTLEGHTAPPLEAGVSVGSRLPRAGDARPQLIFFWAHWCQDCKAESPVLARIADKYRTAGLTIVAPTRRYGYVENGRSANPARELRHIVAVRDAHYPFLKKAAVPVTDANHKAYGVAAVPMHVLIDRQGVVRLYQQGRMSEAELDAAIAPLVDR